MWNLTTRCLAVTDGGIILVSVAAGAGHYKYIEHKALTDTYTRTVTLI